ncbi:MAG TPA: hypothetical protein VGK67_14140 [Myxococcales bacterium]|jgi:hypothetical protein
MSAPADVTSEVLDLPELEIPEVAWALPILIGAVALGLLAWRLASSKSSARAVVLSETRWFSWLVRQRLFPRAAQILTLVGFVGLLASLSIPIIESKVVHPGLVLAWGVWWNFFLLSLALGGRSWCSICPIFFISSELPHWGKKARFPFGLGAAAVVYAGLGVAITTLQVELDTEGTLILLGGLIVGGVVVNQIGPGYAFCRAACPALVFVSAFERTSLVGPRILPAREGTGLSCSLTGGLLPATALRSPELATTGCSLCLKCQRVGPALSGPGVRTGSGLSKPIATALFVSAWSGVLLELSHSRIFWTDLSFRVEQLVPTVALSTLAILAAGAAALALLGRAGAGPRASNLWESTMPLLLCLVVYMVLFSLSHHANWLVHYLDVLFGAPSPTWRTREGLVAPPLFNPQTLAAAGVALSVSGGVHALLSAVRRARAKEVPWRAVLVPLALAAAVAWIVYRPFMEGC